MSTEFTADSKLSEVYANPLGRDVIDRLLTQLGKSPSLVTNRVTSRLTLKRFARFSKVLGADFVPTLLQLLNDTPESAPRMINENAPVPWWKEAVFYQIYPRSFCDSNGDGVGDLRGIIQRLDYLAALGIDCLWLSPIFASPNQDNGYDVSDYRAIMKEMGTLEDVAELISGCHERGMRIILDLVVNHTSDQHTWFQQALADPTGEYGDYYFFRQGNRPPNNWTSFFSGPAWRWLPEKNAWVLHLFANGQLDLNWDNPTVRSEVQEIVQWWLARGIDGFRLDVINYISKREGLPDGNPLIGQIMGFTGVEHYFHGPHLHEYLAELRERGFTRPGGGNVPGPGSDEIGFMVGETPGVGVELGRLFTQSERKELDLIFCFDALETPGHQRFDEYRYDLNFLKHYLINQHSRLDADEWVSVFFENHDNPRMISKVNPDPSMRIYLGKALGAILLLTKGTPFIYQGQEIGAVNQNFRNIFDLRDVESVNRFDEIGDWSAILAGTRDHARVPMRWDTSKNAGFSSGQPWIEAMERSRGFTVSEQLEDANSVLSFYRELISLRRANPALTRGETHYLAKGRKDYFAWIREFQGEFWFVEINLSDKPIKRPFLERDIKVEIGPKRSKRMAPYEVVIGRV